jgi:hypothetical protein
MIVQFMDGVSGVPVYINPSYVVSLRPDPEDPEHVSVLKTGDGEAFRVRGDHHKVADKLARPRPAA